MAKKADKKPFSESTDVTENSKESLRSKAKGAVMQNPEHNNEVEKETKGRNTKR